VKHREVTLDDKYDLVKGHAWMTGIQALVRLPLDQKRLDRLAGHNTAGFISGYRGSPLGGYDQQLRRIQKRLDSHDIHFWEGLNEDLGATAVWGSQQLGLFPGARFEGVFGLWYGKAPGVDRTGDVFKHANAAGSSRLGGVVAVAGDDPMCKSSTLPSQSEYAFIDAEIPTLNPASIQDVLDYGLHGWAMSRYTGAWTGLIALADTMDSGSVVNVDLARLNFRLPDLALPEGGAHMRMGDEPMAKEARLRGFKLPAARAYVRANGLDHAILTAPRPRLGLIVTGQAARDVFEAFAALGLSPQAAADLGVSIWKVAMPWPLEPEGVRAFCSGLERVLVIEHKRPLIEDQLRGALYDLPDAQRPVIEGKLSRERMPLLPDTGAIPLPVLARTLAERLPLDGWDRSVADAYFDRIARNQAHLSGNAAETVRKPHYCSGCPHNTSTVVPEGSRALAGIGCHYMVKFMPERNTDMTSQMGGEGVGWIGQYAFTEEPHVFVNLGDGTYSHSGLLAIRAALTSRANMTYKILYNDAVAMTGGQSVESGQTVDQIARQVEAEGVKTIAIVADDITRYAAMQGLPPNARVYHRDRLEEVQRKLRETPGISVLIYDQVCATEKRRRIKRGKMEDKNIRVLINPDVCEGCGDCSIKSNCLSVEPLETPLGRKRQINQSSCNTDLSCVKGFCPSFVTVQGADSAQEARERPVFDASGLPVPEGPSLERPWNLVFTGVGGTGVTTVAAVLAMAAHIDGNASTSLDMTGLAQKGGPVLSHVRFARTPEEITTGRVPPASIDTLIACDLVVAASPDALTLMDPARTRAVGNSDVTPTSEFIRNRSKRFEADLLSARVRAQSLALDLVDAETLAVGYLHDAIYTNMIMLGVAWQKGLVPVSLRGLYRAIKLNGTAVEDNLLAFDLGRLAVADPNRVRTHVEPAPNPAPTTLQTLVEDRSKRLTDYQNEAYAARYRALVAQVSSRETELGLGDSLSKAVATYAYKVMAYKDEYEVARLYTNGTFSRQLADNFSGKYKMRLHLAPPMIAHKDIHGHLVKRPYGRWMLTAFSVMAKLKGLRGTRFDIFGMTEERRTERALRDAYIAQITRMLPELNARNHTLAVEIASIPDQIRGFGHVKEASLEQARARESDLLAQWPEGKTARRTTLLAAE
jgi:indolepyruvate ferredoxin oxidoreductase